MAEEKGAAAASQENPQIFRVQKVFVKDASFETSRSTEIFTEQHQWKPEVKIQLNTENKKIKDNIYDCTLMLTVTAELEKQPAYLVEVQQTGLFTISGFKDEELAHLLGSYAPSVLFPFVREVVSDLAVKGGFPQLLLDPINFDALYAQHLSSKEKDIPAPEVQH